MTRKFKHSWEKVEPVTKLKHFKCKKCGCEKYYDSGFGRTMYKDIRGNVYYRSTGCIN